MAPHTDPHFLMKCKPVLYPCSYDDILDENPSLFEMCIDVIMLDPGYTEQVLAHIPTRLYFAVMERAVNKCYHKAVRLLVSKWPLRELSLKELWPSLPSLRNVYGNKRRDEMIIIASFVTEVMINAFLQSCKSDGVLKVLDLRGFPIRDRNLKKLAVAVQTLTTEEATKRENQFHIKLDCTISDEDTCHELIAAISSRKNSKLTLHISKIDLSCPGASLLADLFDKLQPQELTGISLHRHSLGNEGFSTVQPIIANFRSITALDISWNNLRLPLNMTIFNRLQHIERLDMSNNRLGSCLSRILPATTLRKLKYLNLSACLLRQIDLIHLYTSLDGKSRMCELDLSENSVLSDNNDVLANLLLSVSDLRILELSNCKFTRDNLDFLVKCLLKLKKLEFVNLATHVLTSSCLIENLPRLGSLPSLKYVGVTYSIDCYEVGLDREMYAHRKKFLTRKLHDEINKWRENNKVKMIWMELNYY